jgi:predicted secreted hydrolase
VNEFRLEPLTTWRSAQTGATYPARWHATLPREGISLEVTPTLPEQEFISRRSVGLAYWEGAVRVLGTQRGRPLRGQGYVELTGYKEEFRSTF